MASLSGSLGPDTNVTVTVPITPIGTTDWIVWIDNAPTVDQKLGGGGAISGYTAIPPGSPGNLTGAERTISWTNGTPTLSGSSSNDIFISGAGLGSGFSFTAPAGTATSTLTIYGRSYSGATQIVATLSDSSAPPVTLTTADPGAFAHNQIIATFTFAAASAGQTLSIVMTTLAATNGASPILQAAALSVAAAAVTDTSLYFGAGTTS